MSIFPTRSIAYMKNTQQRQQSQPFSRYNAALNGQLLILRKSGPLSPQHRKYSRSRLDRLAEPGFHLNQANKPTVLDLLLDSSSLPAPNRAKTQAGTFFFRTVPRNDRERRDEALPPGYYSPNYKVVYRSLPIPCFKKNFKQPSVFSRTRPPTPVDNCKKPTRRHAESEVSSPTASVRMGFTSFAKMSSRPDLFLQSPGANEKRFENFDWCEKDRQQAFRLGLHRKTRAFTKTAARPEVFKPVLEFMPDYSPKYGMVHSRQASYTFH